MPEEINFRDLDALYKPFPAFDTWRQNVELDVQRWTRYGARLEQHRDDAPDQFQKATEIARRAAAVDTGAIEGLYDVDRRFTFTVATQAGMWESAVEAKGPETRAAIESQLEAYEHVLDFATQKRPIAEAWIRGLHEELCRGQKTYATLTAAGVQSQPLPRGTYKTSPNHVRSRDGNLHAYCPVDLVPAEMHRLCEELRSEAFDNAHPVAQAAYAHYALVAVHPFADGNGRVSRALASVFTYRAASIPVMILAENRDEYFEALMRADKGDYGPFNGFVLQRGLDAIQLINECFDAAEHDDVATTTRAIKDLYVTRSGYAHDQIDEAGAKLSDLFIQTLKQAVPKATPGDPVRGEVTMARGFAAPPDTSLRVPKGKNREAIRVVVSTDSPAAASIVRQYQLYVPKDCDSHDDLVLRADDGTDFTARVEELLPRVTTALEWRVKAHADKTCRLLMRKVLEAAAGSIGRDIK